MDPSIFVSIPSYRDPECQYTVGDLFAKAAKPARVFVGICWQADPEEDGHCFLLDPPSEFAPQVRRVEVAPQAARGPCVARARIQRELFQGEDFYLQLDSHYRMIPGWDEELLRQLSLCDSERPILSTYPASYTLPEDYSPGQPDAAKLDSRACPVALCAKEFGADGFLRITGKRCRAGGRPRPGLFWAAGLAFSSSAVVREVPYDETLEDLFFGEESSMAVRLWTSGWDFFTPTQVVGYHLWTRKHRPLFREHGNEARKVREALSRQKVSAQLRGEGGLGARRSLAEYEAFVGLSFAERRLEDRARRGGLELPDFLDGDPAAAASPYPAVPNNIAEAIQAMLGKDAHTALAPPVPPSPPRLLESSPAGRLRREEVELLNTQGLVIIDGFLRERCYGHLDPGVSAQAPRLARRGAAAVPLRPARLGQGEGAWSSSAVRGDEMAWLTMPEGDEEGLLHRGLGALQREAGNTEGALAAVRRVEGQRGPQSDADAKLAEADSEQDLGKQSAECYEDLDVLLAQLALLRRDLDALRFGCERLSTMVARYPPGARYARHRDALQRGRRLTAVYYLNPAWVPEHGGCLRAHLPAAVGKLVAKAKRLEGSEAEGVRWNTSLAVFRSVT
ncbi:unnamed protein product [Effrenium voratum]|nr:unnamed protein product [Effrenium voratum]